MAHHVTIWLHGKATFKVYTLQLSVLHKHKGGCEVDGITADAYAGQRFGSRIVHQCHSHSLCNIWRGSTCCRLLPALRTPVGSAPAARRADAKRRKRDMAAGNAILLPAEHPDRFKC